MARIDPLIESLLCENGRALTLESGRAARLDLPGGPVTPIPKELSASQIRAVLAELAPEDARAALSGGGSASFRYAHPKGTVTVTVHPDGEKLLARIVPGESDATAAPARVEPPPPPPPEKEKPEPRPAVARDDEPAEEPEPPRAKAKKKARARISDADEDREEAVVIEVAPPASMLPVTDAPREGKAAQRMDRLLDEMIDAGASDVHLSTGSPPAFRVDGDLAAVKGWSALPLAELTAMLYTILPARNRKEFESTADTDCAWESARSRFRVNVFQERHGMGAVIRAIPSKVRTVEELGLPKPIVDLCDLPKGLVLVTGPTGSGKSTTLAALVDHVNRTRTDHIITIEDPIEFVHPNKKCVVHQREVAVHTRSFKSALRAALREDPDVVLVGEMRDLETVAIAIETAETGHLVFGTLHTNTAPSTVDRIIDQFPADRQAQIRTMLSETLKAVITQTLCKKIGGGRIAVLEVLIVNAAVSNLIREGKTFQIPSMMQTGRGVGMVTQSDAMVELVRARKVDPREALAKAVAKAEVKTALERAGYVL